MNRAYQTNNTMPLSTSNTLGFRGSSGSDSGSDADGGMKAVSALEGLWLQSRKDHALGLFRVAGPCSVDSFDTSRRSSLASSVVATPHSLLVPASKAHSSQWDDAASDSSELGSTRSTVTSIPDAVANPSPFGVHLEWRLKLRPKKPQALQLAEQRGLCAGCKERLSTSLFNQLRYCHFLGSYFCGNCHQGDLWPIPAYVAQRWDFDPRPVATVSAQFIDAHRRLPLIQITSIRRTKAPSQAVLTEVHMFRQTLTKMKTLLAQSCDFHYVLEGLMLQFDSYMREGHELYTLQDLMLLEAEGRSSSLYTRFSNLVTMVSAHIRACPSCQKNGHYCPICDSLSPVFSFEIDIYTPCPNCSAVFHRLCFQRAGSECPMCLSLREETWQPSIAAVCPR